IVLSGCSSADLPRDTSSAAGLAANARSALRAEAAFSPESAPIAPASKAPWNGPVVYVSPTSTGYVYVYPGKQHPPKKTLYSFNLYPGVENSIQVDTQKNVWFADSFSTWVYEYAPATNHPKTGFETAYTPEQIAVRGKTLYVFE